MMIDAFIQSGSVSLLVVGVMILEVFLLRGFLRQLPVILISLGAGGAMAFALGAALRGDGWHVIAILLVISFIFHILEVRQWLRIAKRLQP